MGNKAIMMTPAKLGGRDATVNYLFDKDGGLFNVAWYVVTPVDDFEAAKNLNQDLENALQAKYGKPIHTFSDGDQAEAEKIKAIQPQDRTSMDKFMEYMQSGGPGKGKKDAGAGGPDLLSLMPHVFYSKLLFWDGGKVWVYTNFICSNNHHFIRSHGNNNLKRSC